ncbi:hypothetical protein H0H87_007271 [Tephrocybe sp. NHM501043]|nr:hypothetical protein H0H87_007271 [Tephrocybe sp. NHM501043]
MKAVNFRLKGLQQSMALKSGDIRVYVGAFVLRQGHFIAKMQDLHWTSIGFFDAPEDKAILKHAIARYHSFLDLMATSPTSFLVPTLDIDLVRHTHQMPGSKYDTHSTTKSRKTSYRLPLTQPVAFGRDALGFRTRTAAALFLETPLGKNSDVLCPASRPPHLFQLSDHDNAQAATHPSDHNAIYAYHRWLSSWKRTQRQKKIVKRERREVINRERHDPGFLIPIPLYYAEAGCVAASGHIIGKGEAAGGGASSMRACTLH